MTDLSPAAQAVLAAIHAAPDNTRDSYRSAGAAALRAIVDQAHPKVHIEDIDYVHQMYVDGWKDALDTILNITDELETH
jgi:Icc-related predicted phosphoesterase